MKRLAGCLLFLLAGCVTVPVETGTAADWVKCANEGGVCNFSGTRQVRYGADGRYVTRRATNGVECSNRLFGDPIPGERKACYVSRDSGGQGGWGQPGGDGDRWVRCASEGGVCNFSGTAQIRYGTDGRFVTRRATDGVRCNNNVFGDPAPGEVKACYMRREQTVDGGWRRCAQEGSYCGFSGSRQVRYGTDGHWREGRFRNGIQCSNQVFGDPAPGRKKACYVADN